MTRLGDVLADVKPGFATGDDLDDGVFQFRMHNFTRESVLDLTKRRRVNATAKQLQTQSVAAGDVLFNATNSPELVGKSALIGELDEPAVFSNHFMRLRSDLTQLDPGYLAHFLRFQFSRKVFRAMAKAWVNQATIGRDRLEGLDIPLPHLPEQRRIAAILDHADALRAKRRQVLAHLDALTHAVFHDMFGDPVSNPKGWTKVSLGERLMLLEYGPRFHDESYTAGGIRIVRITDLATSGSLDFDAMPRLTVRASDCAKYGLSAGDVLFARTGATVGKVALIRDGDPECIAGAYFIRMRFAQDVEPVYVSTLLRSKSIQKIIWAGSHQSAQQNFSGPGLRGLPLILPTLELQREFVDRLEQIRMQGAAALAAQHMCGELFASLQSRAFRGGL